MYLTVPGLTGVPLAGEILEGSTSRLCNMATFGLMDDTEFTEFRNRIGRYNSVNTSFVSKTLKCFFLHWQTCVPLINLQLRFTICRMMHAKDRKRLVKSAAKNHKVCHAIACELHIETCIRLKNFYNCQFTVAQVRKLLPKADEPKVANKFNLQVCVFASALIHFSVHW